MKKSLGVIVLCATLAGGFVLATPEVARADAPGTCVSVLATFFAQTSNGLRTNIQDIMIIAEGFGIPTGMVIANVAHKSGDLNACIGFLFAGPGND